MLRFIAIAVLFVLGVQAAPGAPLTNATEIIFDNVNFAIEENKPIPAFYRDINGRIVDGSRAVLGQFPWQVALILTMNDAPFICGGSLINEKWVLTAGHCVQGASKIDVYLGIINIKETSGRVTIQATRALTHKDYNSVTKANDIALIELSSSVEFTANIGPIALASDRLADGVQVTVSGWGRTNNTSKISPDLNYVDLTTISNRECATRYASKIIDSIVCAKGATIESSCNGDSGGPMITGSGSSAVHVAAVSFGSSAGCDQGDYTAYTRTASFRQWIQQNTGI